MIFFDIDGTLLNFKAAERAGVMATYEAYGQRLEMDARAFYEAWCRVGERHFNAYLQGKKSFLEQQRDRTRELFRLGLGRQADDQALLIFQYYLTAFRSRWAPYDDVLPCLQQLRGRYRLGIISNGDREQQLAKLRVMGIAGDFEMIVTPSDAGVAKPDPGIFSQAVQVAGLAYQDCVYVGDNYHQDVLPSRDLGMVAIWICREGTPGPIAGVIAIKSLVAMRRHLP